MAGLGRMHKQRRCTCGRQGRCNLAPDMATLAHPHHHHAPGYGQCKCHGLRKALAYLRLEFQDGRRFDVEGAVRHRNRTRKVRAGHGR